MGRKEKSGQEEKRKKEKKEEQEKTSKVAGLFLKVERGGGGREGV